MSQHRILQGDATETIRQIDDASQDALLSDAPYGLSFMSKKWDSAVPPAEFWVEGVRILKPGAYGLVFGGTRTYHRLAVALEDAGFEIRDTLMWLYGSGFPKSQDISKAIDRQAGAERAIVGRHVQSVQDRKPGNSLEDSKNASLVWQYDITAPATPEAQQWGGYGSALKPAWEPIILVRKPPQGTNAQNALEHGTGALNIDSARIRTSDKLGGGAEKAETVCSTNHEGWDRPWKHDGGARAAHAERVRANVQRAESLGRFPANLILDPESAAMLDAQAGTRKSGSRQAGVRKGMGYHGADGDGGPAIQGDEGGVSRFFYCAKASRAERDAGLEARNTHPTVKPLDLCRYLATLLLVPERSTPRNLWIPFSGSGSEMIGALQAGWDYVTGQDSDPEYNAIAQARIAHWTAPHPAPLFEVAS